MENGTYIMRPDGKLAPLEVKSGYWVAERERELSDITPGKVIGVWTDDNGKEWIDESHLVSDLPTALALAEAWEQLAVYDNVNSVTISL